MKVVLSNKAYFNSTNPKLWEHCAKQTTYQITSHGSPYPKVFQNSGKMGEKLLWIPTTRLDILQEYDLNIIDKRVLVPVDFPEPTFSLREDQQEIFDKFTSGIGIINGKPGFGKTILALAIAYSLGQKTLVVCTNVMIRSMWEKEIKKWFGFDPGIIGSGKFNIDPPIVVANIQTLNKHALALGKVFGTVIYDEVHHCVATTFTTFLEQSHARYKFGLSGTLKRKDGLNVMFKDFFGFEIFSPAVSNTLAPEVHKYTVDVEVSGDRSVPWATRANEVYENTKYISLLVELVYLYYRAGHKVIVVSDRTWVSEHIQGFMQDCGVPTYKIVGSTPLDERDRIIGEIKSAGPCVLTAAQSIFSEGVSINELSCMIVGSLINNESLIEQLAGRVQRMSEGKLSPVIVDIGLKGSTGWNQARGRISTYRTNGWEIVDMVPKRFDEFKRIVLAEP